MYKRYRVSNTRFDSIRCWFSSSLDSIIYLIIATFSLILLFYGIWEIKPVVVEITDFLGLTSHLTLTYWIGFIAIVFCTLRIYLDPEDKNDLLYLIILIVFGLYIFGVPIFAEENARFPWSYYPSGEVRTVLKTNYVDSLSESPIMTYNSWPSTHFISATLIYLSNVRIESLFKYMPLFWMLSVILLSFSLGKKLHLLAKQSFLISFCFISSFWTFNYYYGPQSIAFLLYIILLNFILTFEEKNRIKKTLLVLFTFAALVMTHLLTSIALIVSFIVSSSYIKSIYKTKYKFILFFLCFIMAWYIYLAPIMFKIGVKEFIKQATESNFLTFVATEKYSTGYFLSRQIIHYSRIAYFGIYAILMVTALILYANKKLDKNNEYLNKIYFSWFFGILALLIFKYGESEIDDRVYIYSLIPMLLIISTNFNRRILIFISVLFVALHVPAHYGSESIDMLYSSELAGDRFFSDKSSLNAKDLYFYYPSTGIRFYNNSMILHPALPYKSILSSENKYNVTILKDAKYVLFTKQLNNFMIYSNDINLNEIQDIKNNNYIYNNGYFDIYKTIR